MNDSGFQRAQAAYDAMLPPEDPEPVLTRIEVGFKVHLTLDVDLWEVYADFEPRASRGFAERFVREYVEGCVEVDLEGLPSEMIEVYDYEVETE